MGSRVGAEHRWPAPAEVGPAIGISIINPFLRCVEARVAGAGHLIAFGSTLDPETPHRQESDVPEPYPFTRNQLQAAAEVIRVTGQASNEILVHNVAGVDGVIASAILRQLAHLGVLSEVNCADDPVRYEFAYRDPTPAEIRLLERIVEKAWQPDAADPLRAARRILADIHVFVTEDEGTDRYPDMHYLVEDIQRRLNEMVRQDGNL